MANSWDSCDCNRLCLIASRDARDGSLRIHQDVDLFGTLIDAGTELSHTLGEGRKGWVQVVSGNVTVNGNTLGAGDGASIFDTGTLSIRAEEDTELLLFDMA